MTPQPQAGIINRPPDHLLLAAINLATGDPATTREAVERLRNVVHHELRSELDPMNPDSPKEQVPAETGELGFESGYDRYRLTITVAFAATAYDKLGLLAPESRPADLRPIPWDQLGDTPEQPVQGDLMLQICTNSLYIAEHVVRRVSEELADVMTVVWSLPGAQRHNSRPGTVSRREGRALIGFLDGSSNLDPELDDDRRLIFVDPDDRADLPPRVPNIPEGQPSPYGGGPQLPTFPEDLQAPPGAEPAWAKQGTYMVVRASVLDMATWDHITLQQQEQTVGRFKVTGNPLGTNPDVPAPPGDPTPTPDFSADPDGHVTPLNSHVRKVNPRGPGDELRRVFRRGYPLILPTTDGLKLGLAFICFGRTITTQFEFITRGWTTNPNFPRPGAGVDQLRSFEAVLGGGYYFVPPLERANQPWSWVIPGA